ncbi:hypothetical protein ACLKA7_001363 [Drosophila subpalustris]
MFSAMLNIKRIAGSEAKALTSDYIQKRMGRQKLQEQLQQRSQRRVNRIGDVLSWHGRGDERFDDVVFVAAAGNRNRHNNNKGVSIVKSSRKFMQ